MKKKRRNLLFQLIISNFQLQRMKKKAIIIFKTLMIITKKIFPTKVKFLIFIIMKKMKIRRTVGTMMLQLVLKKMLMKKQISLLLMKKIYQISCPTNNDLKNKDNNEYSQNKNYPFYPNKINNLIKEESKIKYKNKNKIIIGKNKMNEKLEEEHNYENEEEKVIRDVLDVFVNEEKERIKKSKKNKFEKLKCKEIKEAEMRVKRMQEDVKKEAEMKLKRITEDVKMETEKKIRKMEEEIQIEQENEFQEVDEYANDTIANILIKKKREALNEKIKNNLESLNLPKKIISLREDSDNDELKKMKMKKRKNLNKKSKKYTRPKDGSKFQIKKILVMKISDNRFYQF